MPDCERCGKRSRLTLVRIDRAEMYVCEDCKRFGSVVEKKVEHRPAPRPAQVSRPRKPDALSKRARELVDDYPKRIQRGRECMGLSREDLGRKINERVSVIAQLEHGQMHPSDNLIKKIQKALNIEIMEDIEEYSPTSHAQSSGMTMADFIIAKKK